MVGDLLDPTRECLGESIDSTGGRRTFSRSARTRSFESRAGHPGAAMQFRRASGDPQPGVSPTKQRRSPTGTIRLVAASSFAPVMERAAACGAFEIVPLLGALAAHASDI